MDVFISWSGPHSQAVANALRNWLPKIINALKPWLSSADIEKGARWSSDVASRLSSAKAGIICLTPSNLRADWILFEAGALSKTLENTYVCTLLVGLKPLDLAPPLAQFQATKAEKEDILNLLRTLNLSLGNEALSEGHLSEAFEVWWPKLKTELDNLPPDDVAKSPERSDRQVLEEILEISRNQNRPVAAALSDEDRGHVVEGRATKVIFSLGSVSSMRTDRTGKVIVFDISTLAGGSYKVQVPRDVSFDEIDKVVRAQVPSPSKMPHEPPAEEKPVPDVPKLSGEDLEKPGGK